MRRIRITAPKGVFLGEGWHKKGTIVEVPDDRRARQLVDLGHAELLAPVASLDVHAQPAERATAPEATEKAARR